jgi:hypothetical protein
MVTVKFADEETLKRALGFLLGRFSGRVLRSGEVIVPENALETLALPGHCEESQVDGTVQGALERADEPVGTVNGELSH